MGQYVSFRSLNPKPSSSSLLDLSPQVVRAIKRDNVCPTVSSPPNSDCVRSPPAIPAKRNHSPAVDSSPNNMACPYSWEDKDGLKFHVHQKHGIRICDNFLLGNCPHGQYCHLHHTRYPYHWQLKQKGDQKWRSLSDVVQQQLEKLYSDFAEVNVNLENKQGDSGTLDFDFMHLESLGPYDEIRRLSNTCSPELNPHFPTKWIWYWKNNSEWVESDKPLGSDQLLAFEKGLPIDNPEIQGEPVGVDPNQPEKRLKMGRHQRNLQHRPLFRTLTTMAPYLSTVWKNHSKELQTSIFGFLGEDPTDEIYEAYPAKLLFPSANPTRCQFKLLEVDPREAVYSSTCRLFHNSLSENDALVLRVYRIWNEDLWKNYIRMKETMSKNLALERGPLERHLFYGTWAERNSFICRMNFDPCLPGLCPSIYGQGIYFHTDAGEAHKYTQLDKDKLRYMFLAKVLVGRSVSGEEHYRQSQKKPAPAQDNYDCCVDNVENPKTFVMFNKSHCYPYFLICYKFLSDPVAVGI